MQAGERLQKDAREFGAGKMDMFTIVMEEMVSQVCM